MRGTAYARHMLYVHKIPIDMFYDLDDLEVIVDTQILDPSGTFTGASVLRPSDFHGSPTDGSKMFSSSGSPMGLSIKMMFMLR